MTTIEKQELSAITVAFCSCEVELEVKLAGVARWNTVERGKCR